MTINQGRKIAFSSEDKAEVVLTAAGFSIGRLQRDDPRGVIHGDWDIQKRRNLSGDERAELHGIYKRVSADGRVEVTFTSLCPEEPLRQVLLTAA